jgi:beta-phosphoglucomutase-like phosphatase (HAD superfamily)
MTDAALAKRRQQDDDPLAEAMRQPLLTRNQQDRLELERQEERFARQRRDERALERRIMAMVDQRLKAERDRWQADLAELATASSTAVEAIANSLDDLRDAARAPMVAADAHVKQTLERIEKLIGDLGGRGGCVVDLPNPIARRVN